MTQARDRLRDGLTVALHEPDTRRELDSLENVVALAYLTGQGLVDGTPPAGDPPTTIEAWLAWVDDVRAAR